MMRAGREAGPASELAASAAALCDNVAAKAETDAGGTQPMDLTLLRQEAMEETERFFRNSAGGVPSEDSDEWEDQYRRQFELVKRRHAGETVAPPRPAPARHAAAREPADLPELTGAPTQIRWAETIRADRLRQISNKELRHWLAEAWLAAKLWIDSRDQPLPVFLHKIEPHHHADREQAEQRAAELRARRQAELAAAEAVHRATAAAGITPEGLIELIDVSPRVAGAAIRTRLADLHIEGRHVRIFETAHPAALLVIDESASGRAEYAIERDEGLVADLKLAAQA